MRLIGLTRTGRAIAPLLGGIVVLAVFYGGGAALPAEAYGVSAIVLFPVLAWQTKILLDVEPDTQRQLAVVALGSWRREAIAGLVAAAAATVPVVVLALILPWLIGAVTLNQGGPGFFGAVLLGLWAHAIAVPPAIALGALSSRVITTSAGRAATILAGAVVLAIVLGVPGSPVPWLAPPLLGVARALSGRSVHLAALLPLTSWAVAWALVILFGYGWLRRRRA
jgi:hypothetical protein